MKKISLITAVFMIILTSYASAATKCLDGKLGTAYATDPEKFGWQLNFAYLNELDPFFALGFEPGIYWIQWERTVGREQQGTTIEADVKADTNAYVIPVIVDAQIRLSNLENKLHVKPYITIGLGYSIMILDYSQPGYTDNSSGTPVLVPSEENTKLFHGLTWQLLAGASYDPGPESRIEFLVELGYRGAKLQKGDLEVDMSGFMFNIGIRFPFDGVEPSRAI